MNKNQTNIVSNWLWQLDIEWRQTFVKKILDIVPFTVPKCYFTRIKFKAKNKKIKKARELLSSKKVSKFIKVQVGLLVLQEESVTYLSQSNLHFGGMTSWLILCKGNTFLAVTSLPWSCGISCVKEIFSWPLWLALDDEDFFWLCLGFHYYLLFMYSILHNT